MSNQSYGEERGYGYWKFPSPWTQTQHMQPKLPNKYFTRSNNPDDSNFSNACPYSPRANIQYSLSNTTSLPRLSCALMTPGLISCAYLIHATGYWWRVAASGWTATLSCFVPCKHANCSICRCGYADTYMKLSPHCHVSPHSRDLLISQSAKLKAVPGFRQQIQKLYVCKKEKIIK
jgi:hypothetical protein